MRLLIAGLGSIGRRHLATLRELRPGDEIVALRHERTAEPPLPGVERYVFSLDEAVASRPEAAFICGPASSHVAVALAFARNGTHLFVEKPLSHRLDGIDELIATCARGRLTLMVGYNLRFLESLRGVREAAAAGAIGRILSARAEVGQYLPDWRPQSDYRASVSAREELGGGALLELSHEIDYLRWLCGEITEVEAFCARTSELELDVEDTVEMLVRFEGGAIGSLHLDMVQRSPVRGCRLIGSKGTLTWDGMTDAVRLFSAGSNEWKELMPPRAPNRGATYRAELAHFFDCVLSGTPPLVGGEDGRRIVQIALAAKTSAQERCAVTLAAPNVTA